MFINLTTNSTKTTNKKSKGTKTMTSNEYQELCDSMNPTTYTLEVILGVSSTGEDILESDYSDYRKMIELSRNMKEFEDLCKVKYENEVSEFKDLEIMGINACIILDIVEKLHPEMCILESLKENILFLDENLCDTALRRFMLSDAYYDIFIDVYAVNKAENSYNINLSIKIFDENENKILDKHYTLSYAIEFGESIIQDNFTKTTCAAFIK